MEIKFRGCITEILFSNERIKHFIIKDEENTMKASVFMKNESLVDRVEVGKVCEVTGALSAHLITRNGNLYASNDFFVSDLEELATEAEKECGSSSDGLGLDPEQVPENENAISENEKPETNNENANIENENRETATEAPEKEVESAREEAPDPEQVPESESENQASEEDLQKQKEEILRDLESLDE